MDRIEIQSALRQLGIRVEPEMAAYVGRQLQDHGGREEIAVLGGDARTGVPMRTMVALSELTRTTGDQAV